ncbi:hypothetical protein ABIB59_001525 [Citrobacter sp. UYEF32]
MPVLIVRIFRLTKVPCDLSLMPGVGGYANKRLVNRSGIRWRYDIHNRTV